MYHLQNNKMIFEQTLFLNLKTANRLQGRLPRGMESGRKGANRLTAGFKKRRNVFFYSSIDTLFWLSHKYTFKSIDIFYYFGKRTTFSSTQ